MAQLDNLLEVASGRLGNICYVRNRRGGFHVRPQPYVAPRRSTYAERVKGVHGTLQSYWTRVLTSADREAWDAYAATIAAEDRLGQTQKRRGQWEWLQAALPIAMYRPDAQLPHRPPGTPIYTPGSDYTTPYARPALFLAGDQVIFAINTPPELNPDDWWITLRISAPLGPGQSLKGLTSCAASHGPRAASAWTWKEPGDSPTTQYQGFRYPILPAGRFCVWWRYNSIHGSISAWMRIPG